MYPNPQDALPLSRRPSLEQYEERARSLSKACRSDQALLDWARRWASEYAEQVAGFARTRTCSLGDARLVIARAHGFANWRRLAAHLEALARPGSRIAAYEAAADAIVNGHASALRRLLRKEPRLIRARSSRAHRATLLHYVSANGVENHRQKSPKNAARIAELLLAAGAEVDAEADVYGGHSTTLGLVATSMPPRIAGVQLPVIDVLLCHGARMDHPGCTGNRHALVRGCLANGQHQAAEYLAGRGAPLDLAGAAGIGRVDALARFVSDQGRLRGGATRAELLEGFSFACGYGHAETVEFLLQRGVDVDVRMKGHGDGHTGLHVAAYHARVEVVELLLRHGADVHAIDDTWRTPPLSWALTGWSRKENQPGGYYEVVSRLVNAGATVTPGILQWSEARADPRMLAALAGKPPNSVEPA
jgi:ankyrin repeat protein